MKTKTLFLLVVALFGLTAITLHAQVAINNSAANADPSAILDLNTGNAGNKGFLAPQVALTATNAAAPVTSPATGLIVYNTATAGTAPYNVAPGYYYWNSSAWAGLSASPAPVIYEGDLNTSYTTVTSTPTALGTGTYNFIKQYGSTKVEVRVNTTIYSGNFSGAGEIKYQIYMNGAASSISQIHWTFASGTNEYVLLDATFTGLAAGTYQIQIYANTNAGTSTDVVVDDGGFGGSIVAQEEF